MRKNLIVVFLTILSHIVLSTACSQKIPSYCNNIPNQSSQALTPIPRISDHNYGGPYKYNPDKKYIKVSNFAVYNTYGLNHSSASPLTRDLFLTSITWYCKNNSKYIYGERFQRYNYVVNSIDQIWVAVWNMNISFSDLKKSNFCANTTLDGFQGIPKKDIMINFYPEDTDLTYDIPRVQNSLDNPDIIQSPCRIITPPIEREENDFPGFLDGMSKHFYIAQFASSSIFQGINNYSPKEWTETVVEYAGEIIVDVENCQYVINNWSGTYKPDPPGDYLPKIGILFTKTLGYRPSSIITYDGLEIPFDNEIDILNYSDTFCEKQ